MALATGKNMAINIDCLKLNAADDMFGAIQGGPTPETNEIVTLICSCHNFSPLSSVQILFIPACCLLCVL